MEKISLCFCGALI
uniref:Uncharacterized protein n=1 Tax=Rhizophora mucronata TaxID=61149 RepID=A0A2P2NP26_RHIMU